jgi:hypothetical protein
MLNHICLTILEAEENFLCVSGLIGGNICNVLLFKEIATCNLWQKKYYFLTFMIKTLLYCFIILNLSLIVFGMFRSVTYKGLLSVQSPDNAVSV